MPAALGYGALARAFSGARGLLGRYSTAAASVGAPGSRMAEFLSRMGNTQMGTAMGAVTGGMYGAASEDTSMLGGVLAGAGIGMGAVTAGRGALRYQLGRGRGLNRSQAMQGAVNMLAEDSKRFIGSTYTSAVNAIPSTLKSRWPRI